MRPTTLLQTVFIGRATADFWIYFNARTIGDSSSIDTFQVWDSKPNCDDVWGHMEFWRKDDVSSDKLGVRCVSYDNDFGCEFHGDPEKIDIMEVNFSWRDPVYHWTTYKNVGYPFVGLDKVVYGHCDVATDSDRDAMEYICNNGGGTNVVGKPLLHCKGINGHTLPSGDKINSIAQWREDHPEFPTPVPW
ncbi:hypothetical protein V8F20_007831 [Naviculisporaceae sp. PSN 640]